MNSESDQKISIKDKVVSKAIDAREKVRIKTEPLREQITQIMFDRVRRPALLKHFRESGITDPMKALKVVAYLESSLKSYDGFRKPDGTFIDRDKSYKYSEKDIDSIKILTEGIEDPIGMLEKLNKIISIKTTIYRLDITASYVGILKQYPNFIDLLTKLQDIGPIKKIDVTDIIFETNDPNSPTAYKEDTYEKNKMPDMLREILSLPEEQYKELMNAKNIQAVRELNLKLIEKIQKESNYKEDQEIITPMNIFQMLQMTSDKEKFEFYTDTLLNNDIGTSRYEIGNRISKITKYVNEILTIEPNLLKLFSYGFTIPYKRLESYMSDDDWNKRISELTAANGEISIATNNLVLCRNAKLLSDFGMEIGINSDIKDPLEIARVMATTSLEKGLNVFSLISDSFAQDQKNYWERRFWFKDSILENIQYLESYSLEELIETFSVFKNSNYKFQVPSVPFDSLVKETTSLADIQRRVSTVLSSEFQHASQNTELMTFLKSYKFFEGSVLKTYMWIDLIDSATEYIYLAEHVKELKNNIALLEAQNKYSLNIHNLSLEGLVKLSKMDSKEVQKLLNSLTIKNGYLYELSDKNFESALIMGEVSMEKQHAILSVLKAFGSNAQSLIGSSIDATSIALFKNLTDEQTANVLSYLKKVHNYNTNYFGNNLSQELLFAYEIAKSEKLSETYDKYIEYFKYKAGSNEYNTNYSVNVETQNEAFIEFYNSKRLEPNFDISNYILIDGVPKEAFLLTLTKIETLDKFLTPQVLANLSEESRSFWKFVNDNGSIMMAHFNINYDLGKLLVEHRDEFATLIKNEKPTLKLLKLLAKEKPLFFVYYADRSIWRQLMGENKFLNFLSVLPTYENELNNPSDERRNAFTHNEYDRTSELIKYLIENSPQDMAIDENNIDALTAYVKEYGLAKEFGLFHYFRNLYLKERSSDFVLPQDIQDSQMKSVKELNEHYKRIKESVYSESPITDFSKLTSFETQLLKTVTGKSTHRFDDGRHSMEEIMSDFSRAYQEGSISPFPKEYVTETVEIDNVTITFDTKEALPSFLPLQKEILESIKTRDTIDDIKSELNTMLNETLILMQKALPSADQKKIPFLTKEIETYTKYIESLGKVSNLDEVLEYFLDTKLTTLDQDAVKSIIRRTVFKKVFNKNYSGGYLEEIQSTLEGEVSAKGILSIVNIVDNLIKEHALNVSTKNSENYWSDATFGKLNTKKGKSIFESFNPYAKKLREISTGFEAIKNAGTTVIKMIPDRGFIGEMSAYLADVCYSKEYPLLRDRPNLTPYKFVKVDKATGETSFVGSVLVFEIEDAKGNPSLLVRALNVPKEDQINIYEFAEKVLDKIVKVAKERGKSQVLIPGDFGAISNYNMTVGHMTQRYIYNKSVVSLKELFNFNSHDLTNNCYVAREVK